MKQKLRNLYNKKGVKIAIHIINALVYGFTILMIILLSVGSCSNQHNELPHKEANQVVEKYAYFTDSEGYYSQSGTSIVNEFIPMLLNKVYSTYNENHNNVEIISDFTLYFCPWGYFGQSTPTHYLYKLNEIWIEPLTAVSFGYNQYYVPVDVSFYVHGENVPVGSYRFNFVPKKFVYNNTTYNNYSTTAGACIYFTTETIPNNMNGFYMFRHVDNPHIWDCLLQTIETTYLEGYQNGYGIGYNEGKDYGYEQGYNVGTSSNSNNIFSIIQAGFNAVATLFNVQIFPGITLATLMFIPLVVLIVIALMHIFKG